MASEASPGSERFQTVTTILIALVSTAIALVASQAAVVAGNSTEAQENGVIAKINLERVDGGHRIKVARNHRAFDEYRFHRALWSLTSGYIRQQMDAGRTTHETRLRQEAAGLLEESNLAYQFVESGYLQFDETTGDYTQFDEEAYLGDGRQRAAIYEDIDSADDFTEAVRLREQALAMNLSLIVLFVSVMFLTWAQITHSLLKWVWLAAGLLIALATGLAYLLVPLLSRLAS
jgi:hypothetical protein